ncbi:M16 family metallopeptidase [Roseateles amylovorans]|uniref:Insulinase family protein n=1 Tax=Roseateles amylovorans TaxID=2978473 RepID=A0ABY6AZE7_9BURK|nr:pitrilysin family protein [Roseateles amylovorans]UXH77271.1 insulinase family protein [Roseateles amylovorans]
MHFPVLYSRSLTVRRSMRWSVWSAAVTLSLAAGGLQAQTVTPSSAANKVSASQGVRKLGPTPAKASAKAGATQPTFVRELGGISEYRLPNGLQILLFPDEAQSTTTVNITYRVGSRHESSGEYGMAHLLEHLMFKGTPTHRRIDVDFASRGMRANGTTTADRTNYYAEFNADPKTLDFALTLEADRMVHSFIAKSALDSEMTVVRNEFELAENDPLQVLNSRVLGVAYDWHNYGHDTLGPKSDIENVPIERLQAFYKRFYRPDNATLMVAGRFDVAKTLALIGQRFGPVARPKFPIPHPYTVEPAQDGERSVVVRRIGGQPALMAYYHVPAFAHPDSAPLRVLGLLLSLEPSGQLYKALVEPRLALTAGLSGLGGTDAGGIRAFAVLPPDADRAAVEARLLDIVEGRNVAPFDEAELARVRDLAVTGYREQMKNPEALIQQISSLGVSDWRLLFQLMEDLPKVTLQDVERVRRAYLRPANRTLGRYLPSEAVERVEIPLAPPMDQRLAGLTGPPKVEDGERFDPTPKHLADRTVTRQLPSGIALSTLTKRTRGKTVTLQMKLRWGERRETFQHLGTEVVASLMSEGAVGLSKQALQDRLIQLKANLNIRSGDQGAELVISAEQDTLIDALQVAAELMQRPLLPQDAFERERASALAALEGARQELETLRQAAVRDHYNRARGVGPTDPDYLRSIDEQVANVKATSLADIQRFHADYWSANDAHVAVVGAVPDGLDAAVEQLFGAWKKPQAPQFVRHIGKADQIPAARFDAVARDKTSAAMRMRLDFALNDRHPDYLPLVVATHILGAGGLESRLSVRVRDQAGLSYGVGASLSAAHFGDDAELIIGGSFAPQNRERMLTLVGDELRRMSEQGITPDELRRAKADLMEARRQARADDGELAAGLLSQRDQGETWADEDKQDAQVQALTVEQVNAAWRRHIRLDGFVTSTVGDFKDRR